MPPAHLVSRTRSIVFLFSLALATSFADCQTVVSLGNCNTPELQAYLKIVQDAIGARWYSTMVKKEWPNLGSVRIDFLIDRNGKVKNLRVLSNTAGSALERVSREAIKQIRLPPIPEPLRRQLQARELENEITFTIFPN